LHFLSLMLGSVLVLMLPLLVWLTPDLRIKKSLLKCNWTIRKRLPRCKMRLKDRKSGSAGMPNRSSDLGATCDDKSAQIYARFDKNDWRIQPAEFYRFHDAEVNTFGYF